MPMPYSGQLSVDKRDLGDGRTGDSNPSEIASRIENVCAFHETTKAPVAAESTLVGEQRTHHFRVFGEHPRIVLPTHLLDLPVGTLRLMSMGKAALPESLATPPQNLQTLATWLHMAAGITGKVSDANGTRILRAYPSAGGLYPCEVYVLAMGIADLQPGLYHFSAKEFSLRKLREGWESISQLTRGRPDLDFLKTTPAVLLVTSVMWRSSSRYGARAYRYVAIDAGHLIENLSLVATGLGIQTVVRLQINDRNSRELIGVPKTAPFDEFEPVHGLVAWADKAVHPIDPPAKRTGSALLAPIPRPKDVPVSVDHPEIRNVHEQCVAPGVGIVEIRPPYTEVCPMLGSLMVQLAASDINVDTGLPQAIKARRSIRHFEPHGISRDHFGALNRAAFRGGSYYPVMPEGPHMGIVRPFWYVHGVTGVQPGLWFYHANHDQFTPVRYGDYRFDAKYLFHDQAMCSEASAVCVMCANLKYTMEASGPDAYRLAHIEAGIAAERLYLACAAMGIECCAAGDFADNELKRSLDLAGTDWECLHGFAVGGMRRQTASSASSAGAVQFR